MFVENKTERAVFKLLWSYLYNFGKSTKKHPSPKYASWLYKGNKVVAS